MNRWTLDVTKSERLPAVVELSTDTPPRVRRLIVQAGVVSEAIAEEITQTQNNAAQLAEELVQARNIAGVFKDNADAYQEMIERALDENGAPRLHPIKPGAMAAKPFMPQERIAWLANQGTKRLAEVEALALRLFHIRDTNTTTGSEWSDVMETAKRLFGERLDQ